MDTNLFIEIENKPRLLSLAWTFIAGSIVGFCVAFYIEVMSRPVTPRCKDMLPELEDYTVPKWLEPAEYLDDTKPVKVED